MIPNQHYQRIDTMELKNLIIRKIGHHRGKKYFDQLNSLFCFKLSKCEFDRLSIRTIGRENIPLHNRFIRSIFKNACLAKVPARKGSRKVGSNVGAKTANGYRRNSLQSLYGDAFPKVRSPVNQDHKFRDRRSPLGPFGKQQSVASREQESPTELLSLGSRPPIEVASVEDGEEVEQFAGSPCVQSRSPVRAPLGVSINLGGVRKAISRGYGNNHQDTCQNSGELPDTRSLKSNLQKKLEMESMKVSLDCVNLLNNGLDAYLKRLIEPCLGLAGSRCENEHLKQPNGQFSPALNGILPRRNMQKSTKSVYGTMSDFSVSMELNPKVLGEGWPSRLEKIFLRAYEE